PAKANITVSTTSVKNVEKRNAVLQGKVTKDPSVEIGDCGFYLGTSSNKLRKVVTFDAGAAANAKGGGTGFDIWCDLNTEAGVKLVPGTKYYYRCFAVYNGTEYTGAVNGFTTPETSAPTT
ncbi:MAG: hypothetical protein IKJ54_01535, partial [Anaerotignum sp.]|nr:hypothetical protein [Anaerotignum sp.]